MGRINEDTVEQAALEWLRDTLPHEKAIAIRDEAASFRAMCAGFTKYTWNKLL